MAKITLTENLEELALSKFDQLVESGELFYTPSVPEVVEENGFQFAFYVSPSIAKKPSSSAAGYAPAPKNPLGPFVDPDPNFVITQVGPHHTLEFNMFCVYRPKLLLHTTAWEAQSNALNEKDIAATWAVLHAMNMPQMILYNCGVKAGASQGHKHIQLFPKPEIEDFRLFPDRATLSQEEPLQVPGIPYRHRILALSVNATSNDVFKQYSRLLEKAKLDVSGAEQNFAHNVLATRDWILVIPRRNRDRNGQLPTNGAGMLGLMWCSSQDEKDGWTNRAMTEHLAHVGFPC
ncbi:hypothetical protein BGZ60DRAFT_420125 [Tricladium varicosporioides]|nr:hypothetical protein BGZ60DRAFT_420125 [Hymenoscyphus varicosporioides]